MYYVRCRSPILLLSRSRGRICMMHRIRSVHPIKLFCMCCSGRGEPPSDLLVNRGLLHSLLDLRKARNVTSREIMYRIDSNCHQEDTRFVPSHNRAFSSLPISLCALARRSLRRIFPLGFFGIASTNTTPPVILFNFETLRVSHSPNSSLLTLEPGFRTM